MVSIDEIILRSITPFDNFRSVNFWYKQQQPEPTVDSIHQEVIAKIEAILDQVAQNHHTPTVILDGDAGSGKIYLLGRLKKKFNHKAFFIYIPPFPQSDYIWRQILRYTVHSLVQIPVSPEYFGGKSYSRIHEESKGLRADFSSKIVAKQGIFPTLEMRSRIYSKKLIPNLRVVGTRDIKVSQV